MRLRSKIKFFRLMTELMNERVSHAIVSVDVYVLVLALQ